MCTHAGSVVAFSGKCAQKINCLLRLVYQISGQKTATAFTHGGAPQIKPTLTVKAMCWAMQEIKVT